MRYLFLALLCFFSSLNAIDLINESFDSPPNMPVGWTIQSLQPTFWSVTNSNNAGGSPGELRLNYNPPADGIHRFISPAFDTRRVNDMNLSFRYMLDDYEGTTLSYDLQMQISTDMVNWTALWSRNAGEVDIPATQVSVPVSYTLGQSETTYLAVTFVGNTYNMNNWYVDNILLSHSSYVGVGLWPAGNYEFLGDLFVPDGTSLVLSPGSTLRFLTGRRFQVNGNLQCEGTADQPITLSSLNESTNWYGLKFINTFSTQDSSRIGYTVIERSNSTGLYVTSSNKIRIHNCSFIDNSTPSYGGAVFLEATNAILENSLITGSYSPASAAGLLAANATGAIRNNIFRGNVVVNGGVVALQSYNLSKFTGNAIVQNLSASFGSYGLAMYQCYGVLSRQIIANNNSSGVLADNSIGDGPILQNCLIVNNGYFGVVSEQALTLNSSIIWGNGTNIHNTYTSLHIHYCCVEGGQSGISGIAVPNESYICNIATNPLFVSPTPAQGADYDPLTADWTLQSLSPCIDAGDPDLPLDEDLSVVDIGMYSLPYRPLITRLADVTPDQGHQLDLVWNRCPVDVSFQPQAIYSVWRQDAPRAETRWLASPLELQSDLQSSSANLAFRDGDRVWYYIAQVPAMNFSQYGLIVPTIQDSSATGLHAVEYTVIYHAPERWWQAISQTAYSVDNIPPLPATNPLLQRLGGDLFLLSWDEVTEGTWAGNSYPELNLITYKIYESDTPSFTPGTENLVGISTDPNILLNSGTAKRFYRIVVTDSEGDR